MLKPVFVMSLSVPMPTITLHYKPDSTTGLSTTSFRDVSFRDTHCCLFATNRSTSFSDNWQAKVKKSAQAFKNKRMALGLTQQNVADIVNHFCNKHLSQGTISRYESGLLSVRYTCKLANWLEKSDAKLNSRVVAEGIPCRWRRKTSKNT